LWAWAPWRIKKLLRYCDNLACILPFEQQWYRKRGVKAEFVGNPLLENCGSDLAKNSREYGDFNAENATLALMPGSRKAEINSLWKPMQRVALRIKNKWPGIKFAAAAVDRNGMQHLQARQIKGFTCEYAINSVGATAGRADFTIVASGSATLQVAAAGCPMVIMYQSSRILWHLFGRWLVKSKYLSLVNILADKELVPEFMPYFGSIDPVVQKCVQLLGDRDKLAQVSSELIKVVEPLAEQTASEKVAEMAIEMLAQSK